jgi:chromate transport protein ChrA
MFWCSSLPGAIGMYGLSIGVSTIDQRLPGAVYALLSGLNAATVGIIALAAVELAKKAITDRLTRILVFLSAAAGMLYNALWYFPVLMTVAGLIAVIYDYHWIDGPIRRLLAKVQRRKKTPTAEEGGIELPPTESVVQLNDQNNVDVRGVATTSSAQVGPSDPTKRSSLPTTERRDGPTFESAPRVIPQGFKLNFSWKVGGIIIASFFASFITVMILRGVLPNRPMLYGLFGNLYLAGTIIFGGGPVVIPLLREYIVAEGWVSPRDFLIGLAIAQAFPGPNFNFAVFLGSLTAINNGYPSIAGALIGFLGIFAPGLVLVHGTMGLWGALRSRRWVKSAVRGVNAGAVGLIYCAVYRIWQVGYIDEGFQSGRSLGDDPWWVVVTATAYVGGRYFNFAAPVAIVIGAVLGLVRFGVVSASQSQA